MAEATGQGSTPWSGSTGRGAARSCSAPPPSHVDGMDFDDGRALLLELLDRSTAPELVYRHEWEVGDLVIWDNRGVLHRACRYDASSARDMHRTTIAGDEPIQ